MDDTIITWSKGKRRRKPKRRKKATVRTDRTFDAIYLIDKLHKFYEDPRKDISIPRLNLLIRMYTPDLINMAISKMPDDLRIPDPISYLQIVIKNIVIDSPKVPISKANLETDKEMKDIMANLLSMDD